MDQYTGSRTVLGSVKNMFDNGTIGIGGESLFINVMGSPYVQIWLINGDPVNASNYQLFASPDAVHWFETSTGFGTPANTNALGNFNGGGGIQYLKLVNTSGLSLSFQTLGCTFA